MAKSFTKTVPDAEISVGIYLGEKGEEEDSGWAEMGNQVGRKQFGPGDQQNRVQVMMAPGHWHPCVAQSIPAGRGQRDKLSAGGC